jgi:TrmH family RNA methyltransferase
MALITSRQNPVVRRFREIARTPSADELLLDGPHLLAEALLAHLPVEVVAVDSCATNGEIAALSRRAEEAGARVLEVSPSVLDTMSPVRNPSGIVAIAQRRESTLDQVLGDAPQMVLMLEHVQDPGNVGAIIRAADACGATGVVVGAGSADPYGWKALRGSMGSAFRLPVAGRQNLADAIEHARRLGLQLLAAVPRDGTSLPSSDLRGPIAIVLGGEGAGVSADLLELMDGRLTIPMRPTVDSLNVATAAALIAYEAQRQRSANNEAQRERSANEAQRERSANNEAQRQRSASNEAQSQRSGGRT